MKKIPDWEISFDAYINRNINTPFEWGKWDCVMFTNGFIKTMTKKDLLPNTWKWETEEQAMQSIFKYGKGKGLAAAIDNAIKKNYRYQYNRTCLHHKRGLWSLQRRKRTGLCL